MGIDLLDIAFRLEHEFGVDIRDAFEEIAHPRDPTSEDHSGLDIQVEVLVKWIETALLKRAEVIPEDLFPRVQIQIAECLGVEVAEVIPDAWLHRDLGMD